MSSSPNNLQFPYHEFGAFLFPWATVGFSTQAHLRQMQPSLQLGQCRYGAHKIKRCGSTVCPTGNLYPLLIRPLAGVACTPAGPWKKRWVGGGPPFAVLNRFEAQCFSFAPAGLPRLGVRICRSTETDKTRVIMILTNSPQTFHHLRNLRPLPQENPF